MLEAVSFAPVLDAVVALVADVVAAAVAAALVSDEVPPLCSAAIREERSCSTSATVVGVDAVDAAVLAAAASVELVAAVVSEVCCDA